jgi:hypothetical protein
MKTVNALSVFTAALMKIGSHNGSARPQPTNDVQKQVAWEYYVATTLAKLAETRKENALKAAVANGVLPDYKKQPLTAGKSAVPYDDDVVSIVVATRTAATKFDKALFLGKLKAKHPKLAAEIDAIEAECTSTNAVPHVITPALKE